MAAGQQGDDAVGFTEFGRAQHDAFVTIQRHKRFLPFLAYRTGSATVRCGERRQ